MELVSIADASPRNFESSRSKDLIPPAIQSNAKNFITLLESYYDYLNSSGLPSREIQSLNLNKDIDRVSDKYLSQLEQLIGNSVPGSQVLTRLELYKLIIRYYNTRGSEDSIHLFFRLFLNEVVNVTYPKENLFNLSQGSGEWVDGEYVYHDNKSFLSNDFKLFDGHYYQDYSYVIELDIDSELWQDDYVKFVHPAGMKLFTAIVIELSKRNDWTEYIDYAASNIDENAWLSVLVPPNINDDESIAFHTPKYQPGYLRDTYLKYLFTYLFDHSEEDLLRISYYKLKYFIDTNKFRDTFVRNQYQLSEKFIDPTEIGAGFLDKIIGDGDKENSRINRFKILNIGSFIRNVSTFENSYFDLDDITFQNGWDTSHFNLADQSSQDGWESSSFEGTIPNV